MSTPRHDGRAVDALRPVTIETGFTKWAEGSVLCAFGDTKVLCNATVDEQIPRWMKGQGKGWVTAEYSMLPRSTDSRNSRESVRGKLGGRTHEISRLIGRSLRAAVDLKALGERQIMLDCDVIQADGGTRTASITGAYVALCLAIKTLKKKGLVRKDPIIHPLAAVSVGVVDGRGVLDLDYPEDQNAETDMNLVMTADGGIVEVQGTAEKKPFTRDELTTMLDLGQKGVMELIAAQIAAIEAAG